MVGSTALAETKPATEVVELLNHFFETVVHAVAAEGGWVNKFEGDAALCVFGAPVAQTDHAERALRAARRLRDGLLKLRASHPDLDFGIGVATGSVVAGNVGSEQRYEYTVIGSPVNEAARLTEHAKARASRVLISDSTIAAADATVGYRPAGEVALRGLPRPTAVHEPVDDDAAAITGQAATTNEQPTTEPPAQP